MDVLDPARSALVVVHMVKGVAGRVDTPFNRLFQRRVEETGIIKAQLRLLEGFRRAKAKVIFTAVTYQPGLPGVTAKEPTNMTRHRIFSNGRAMVLAGTLALLSNAKAFPVDVTSGDWPEVNHDNLGTPYRPLAMINDDQRFPAGQVEMLVLSQTVTSRGVLGPPPSAKYLGSPHISKSRSHRNGSI